MDVIKYHPAQSEIWEEIVKESNNGTIFHTRMFLNYHPADRFTDHSIIFRKKGKPFVVFPAVERRVGNEKRLISHPGTSYGSFVVPENLSFSDSEQLVSTLVDYAGNNGFSNIKITIPPTIYNKRLSNYIDFSLLGHGFSYVKREVSSILFIEENIQYNLNKFRPSHRQAVRKARRHRIEVGLSDDIEKFYEILKRNLEIRHGVEPTHTLTELKSLMKLFPEDINLFGAYYKNKMIAGVVNFICNSDVVLAFYISHDEVYQETRALNLLFYKIFEWAIQEEYKVFDFGIFTVNEVPNLGLARFKENFGASGMFRDTLKLVL